MSLVRVGTFNLNNLFSRFNFSAELPADEVSVQATTTFTFADPQQVKLREYQGRLVTGKPAAAVQEVEDVDTLTRFAREELDGLEYRFVVLVEGNDPRLIDVGVLLGCRSARSPRGGTRSTRMSPVSRCSAGTCSRCRS